MSYISCGVILDDSDNKNTMQSSENQREYNFVSALSTKYVCCICTSLLREPHLTECCGNHFCAHCLEKWSTTSSIKQRCPHCRHAEFTHILDKPLRREINDLEVYCSSKKLGCAWQGTLTQVEEHLKTCDFVHVSCVHCTTFFSRRELSAHGKVCPKRTYNCQFCASKGHFCDIMSLAHFSQCPGYLIHCPNFCGIEKMKRSQLASHKQVCPNECVECSFKEVGCEVLLIRKDLESHLASKNQSHMLRMMEAFRKQRKEQSDKVEMLQMFKETMEITVVNLRSKVRKVLDSSCITSASRSQLVSIEEDLMVYPLLWLSPQNPCIKLIIDSHYFQWTSRPFFINQGYKFVLKTSMQGTSKELSLDLLPGEHDDHIEWPPAIDFGLISVRIGELRTSNPTPHTNISLNSVSHTMPKGKPTSGRKFVIYKGLIPDWITFKELELRYDTGTLVSVSQGLDKLSLSSSTEIKVEARLNRSAKKKC